ncbi:MAG TPA: RdgB/HAM1 family non-canonical purine NTP pyrophosphatase [Epsilonproteobacteria bacterium]|nr:RdgB/HAM1 family non-canonical purine NTP pyrophosphatase [Campylobacterota bacterium]
MKIVLATSNSGKIKEFSRYFDTNITPYSDIIAPFEIIEDGDTFAANALIKARAVQNKVGDEYIVLADDSGISLPLLGGKPGIYSARYARVGASDRENLNKLVETLKQKDTTKTPAYYTAAIALVFKNIEYVTHGWMHGSVVDTPKGEGGFGYDPMFIPHGHKETLGELPQEVKKTISHRFQALKLMLPLIKMLQRENP